MQPYRALAVVAGAQLAAGLAGQLIALRRRRAFDVRAFGVTVLRGDPAHVGRDSWWAGTALSAPVHMLALHAWGLTRVATGHDDGRAALRRLGAVMVPGYLGERLCRERLRPSGADPVETPVVLAGLTGAAAMAALARPPQPGVEP